MVRELLTKMFNPIYRALMVYGEGSTIYQKQRFEEISKEGYSYNAEVFASVRKLAQSVASVPYKIIEHLPNGETVEVPQSHPLHRLLRRPNDYQSWQELVEAYASFYVLQGNSYMQPLSIEGNARQKVSELHVWRPDKIKILQGNATRPILGYEYEENGVIVKLPYDGMIHWKTWNPMEWWYGLSPVTPASYAIDLHSEYNKHNFNVIKRGARHPSYLQYEGKLLTQQQVEKIRDDFESKYGGADNAGKPPIVYGGLSMKELNGFKPVDMDWIDGQMNAKRQINTAFGVPSELLNDVEAKKYGNLLESRRMFWIETVIPTAVNMYATLTRGVAHRYSRNIEIVVDKDKIDGIQGERSILYDKITNAYKEGLLNREEARLELGHDPE
jgi:HK97 family phage portal protein